MIAVINKKEQSGTIYTTQVEAAKAIGMTRNTLSRKLPYYEDANRIIMRVNMIKNKKLVRTAGFNDIY